MDGGGWKPEWVEKYNKGHRGLICLMQDVDDLDEIYRRDDKYLFKKYFGA